MKNLKHTPGPWSQDGFSLTSVIAKIEENEHGKIYRRICHCNSEISDKDFEFELNYANARLIAAAPEMLEVLIQSYKINENSFDGSRETEEIIRNIIEKATGKKIEDII